jgi:hypothetical protein
VAKEGTCGLADGGARGTRRLSVTVAGMEKGESSVWEVRQVETVSEHGNRLDVQVGFMSVLGGFHVGVLLVLYLT